MTLKGSCLGLRSKDRPLIWRKELPAIAFHANPSLRAERSATEGFADFLMTQTVPVEVADAVVEPLKLRKRSLPTFTTDPIRELVEACGNGRIEVIEDLLNRGVDVNGRVQGDSALHRACEYGQLAVVELLLKSNADPTLLNDENETCLHMCAHGPPNEGPRGQQFVDVASRLIDAGCPIDAQDCQGFTALHDCVAISALSTIASDTSLETTSLLLEEGCQVDVRDDLGETALACAARLHASKHVRRLLVAGASVHSKDSLNLTPADKARATGRISVANHTTVGEATESALQHAQYLESRLTSPVGSLGSKKSNKLNLLQFGAALTASVSDLLSAVEAQPSPSLTDWDGDVDDSLEHHAKVLRDGVE